MKSRKIEAESRRGRLTKPDAVRKQLPTAGGRRAAQSARFNGIADLIGSVEGLPEDLSSRRRHYLKCATRPPRHR